MTAFAAILPSVARPSRGSTIAASSSASRPPSMACVRCGVGGSTGSPSVQPRAANRRFSASMVSGARMRSGASGALNSLSNRA